MKSCKSLFSVIFCSLMRKVCQIGIEIGEPLALFNIHGSNFRRRHKLFKGPTFFKYAKLLFSYRLHSSKLRLCHLTTVV